MFDHRQQSAFSESCKCCSFLHTLHLSNPHLTVQRWRTLTSRYAAVVSGWAFSMQLACAANVYQRAARTCLFPAAMVALLSHVFESFASMMLLKWCFVACLKYASASRFGKWKIRQTTSFNYFYGYINEWNCMFLWRTIWKELHQEAHSHKHSATSVFTLSCFIMKPSLSRYKQLLLRNMWRASKAVFPWS